METREINLIRRISYGNVVAQVYIVDTNVSKLFKSGLKNSLIMIHEY